MMSKSYVTVRFFRTIFGMAVFCLGMFVHAPVSAQDNAGLTAWNGIADVLRHPRCLNCHQENVPLQGDMARIHIPHVVRGPDGQGVTAMKCANCHNVETGRNNSTSRTPGAPHWHLAPASMKWAGLSSGELCRVLKNKDLNGAREPAALVEHMNSDPLVLWGWNPGEGRQAVPLGHEQFVGLLEIWVKSGLPCPE